MYKIGIWGSENSHADTFATIFEEEKDFGCKVVAVGGQYEDKNLEVSEKYNIEFIAEKPEDMIGKVDAVMITSRDGKYHAGAAEPLIKAKIPVFIDKPIANHSDEALSVARLAKQHNVPICGGSALKYAYDILILQNMVKSKQVQGGMVSAPLSMNNEYGGFYFYSSHLAEMSMTIFGYDPSSVMAFENNGNVTAAVKYDDYIVTNHFMDNSYASYHGIVFTREQNFSRPIDFSMTFRHEAKLFVEMLRTGKSNISLEELIKPVFYLNAVEKSYKKGIEVKVHMPKI